MIKGYKIRIYPTKDQEQLIWEHIGACRYIWNWMLAYQEENYKNGGKFVSAFSMNKLLTPLKNDGEHSWLYEVSATSLQKTCNDLANAYNRFFKKTAKHPKFKSKKRSKTAYPVNEDRMYFADERYVQIQMLGRVKYKTDFSLPFGKEQKFSNARISNANGKWMLSFGMECENQVHILTDNAMGIDVGIKDTMIVAYGNEKLVFQNINKSKKVRSIQSRIKHLQRSISRKYEANKQGSRYIATKNIEREKTKLKRLYAKLSNIRMNYIHQATHTLISLLPYKVVMEDLNVTGMMKNHHLAKAIQEQCFYEIIRQMRYKCEWNGISFIQADRFYPSSRTCSSCGCIKHDLKLSDRTFICPECGFIIDRDYQAALNLQRYIA